MKINKGLVVGAQWLECEHFHMHKINISLREMSAGKGEANMFAQIA